MKRKMTTLICALLVALSIPGLAHGAAPIDSDYFSAGEATARARGNGEIYVEIRVTAAHTMLEVGAKRVDIYERQSSGSYSHVFTFNYTNSDYYRSLIDTNSVTGIGGVSYEGTPGVTYYAKCTLYARDSAGSETMVVETDPVVCQ